MTPGKKWSNDFAAYLVNSFWRLRCTSFIAWNVQRFVRPLFRRFLGSPFRPLTFDNDRPDRRSVCSEFFSEADGPTGRPLLMSLHCFCRKAVLRQVLQPISRTASSVAKALGKGGWCALRHAPTCSTWIVSKSGSMGAPGGAPARAPSAEYNRLGWRTQTCRCAP